MRGLFDATVAVALLGGALLLLRFGLMPEMWNPLPRLDLAQRPGAFVDWQLAALGRDLELCRTQLAAAGAYFAAVDDRRVVNGCGYTRAVTLKGAAGAAVVADPLTCEMAAGMVLWLREVVQPAARLYLNANVARVQHVGAKACRNIAGAGVRSEHARANAIDITGFTLADGRAVSVREDWKGDGPKARFLRHIHAGACATFRVVLGPNADAAHKDHFHLDRGASAACR